MKPLALRSQAPPWNAPAWSRSEWLLGLFLLGLIPRLGLLVSRPDALDFWEYETLATNIANGYGYVIYRFSHVELAFGDGNLYSFLAAAVYLIAGHQPLVLAGVQAVIASLAGPVIFAIGARAFGWPVAGLGAALATLHPGLLAYTLKLHPLGLDVLLMALVVLWAARAGEGFRTGVMAGLSLGLTLMSRPTLFVAGIAAMGVRWGRSRYNRGPLVAAVAVALLVAAPWLARNWAVLGRPVFISTSLEDVWKGNNNKSSGSSYLPSGEVVLSAASPGLTTRIRLATELELNDVFGQEVVEFVVQRPADFAAITARKFVYFWWMSPQAGILYPSSWLAAYGLYAALILAFAGVGALVILRVGSPQERSLLGMLAAIGFALAVIHALSYVEGRHRWAIEPLLLLLTARGFFATARLFRNPQLADHLNRRWSPLALGMGRKRSRYRR